LDLLCLFFNRGGESFDFSLLLCVIRFQFLNFAVLFDEIVEQNRRRMARAVISH